MAENDLYLGFDTKQIWREVTSFPVGYTDGDGYAKTISGKHYIRQKTGIINCQEQGVFANGSDMTTRLNTALAKSKIKMLEIEVEGGGDITINGTVNCQGKVLRFRSGTKFIGSGTINNAIISADYQDHIFATTISLTNCKNAAEKFSIKWFGAVGDNVTDDQPAIQKAFDTVVANINTIGKDVFFPKGWYKIFAPLIVYKWDGTDYQFVSINIIGGSASHFSDPAQEVIINANFTNKFALGLQRVRSLTIKGICIAGLFNPDFNTLGWDEFYEGDYSTWASQFSVRDSPNSPYAGIVVDPFMMNLGDLPPDGGYPDMEEWYRGNTQGGSSGVLVQEVRVYGFTVDFCVSPATQTYNAENIHLTNIAFEVCKVAYSSSQRQEKDNSITNMICWDRVHTVLDSVSYGQGQGAPPNIDRLNVANRVVRLFNIPGLQHTVCFKNIYAESLYRIGNLQGILVGISLESSYFDFRGMLPMVPSEHCLASTVKFDSCTLKYYDDLFNKRICFRGDSNTFINCVFDKLPFFSDRIETQGTSNTYINCKGASLLSSPNPEAIGYSYWKGVIASRNVSLVPCGNMRLENAGKVNDYIRSRFLEIRGGSPDIYINVDIVGGAFSLNETTRIGTLTTTYHAYFVNDDYVIALDLTTNKYISLGRVTNVNRTTGVITISEVPYGVDDTHTFFTGYLPKVRRIRHAFIVDAVSSSPNLSNVDADDWGGNIDDYSNNYSETLERVWASINSLTDNSAALYGNDIEVPSWGSNGDGSITEYFVATVDPDEYVALFPTASFLMKTYTKWLKKPAAANTEPEVYVFTTPGYLNAAAIGKTRQAVWQLEGSGGGTATVPDGGTGLTSLTAYALVAGGTTSTGNMQQVSGLGTSGHVLTSNGAGALPTWQAPTSNSDLTGGAIKANIQVVNDADYTVAADDFFIVYSNITTTRTLTLPSAAANANRMLIIKHGGSGASSITLSTAIRENSSTTGSSIPQNYSYGIISDGTDWWIQWISNG